MDFYEFFSGGGMARLGLGDVWRCTFANDVCPKKCAAYRLNFAPADELHEASIADLIVTDLPGQADLAWASFPCQDLSQAGAGKGLRGRRSGTYWAFHDLMVGLRAQGRAPRLVVLENVQGALTANGGRDFQAIADSLVELGYQFGAFLIDARYFTPQSRPRLFIVALDLALPAPEELIDGPGETLFRPPKLLKAQAGLSATAQRHWRWWRLPEPTRAPAPLSELVQFDAADWRTEAETQRLLGMMAEIHRERVHLAQEEARNMGRPQVGAIYRRIRTEAGRKVQRAEVRFDGKAGCLRTPTGGSSRQTLIVVEPERIRTRLLSAREAARLQGLPETYQLPERYNEAYHLIGDGLCVPVIAWLSSHLLQPLAAPALV